MQSVGAPVAERWARTRRPRIDSMDTDDVQELYVALRERLALGSCRLRCGARRRGWRSSGVDSSLLLAWQSSARWMAVCRRVHAGRSLHGRSWCDHGCVSSGLPHCVGGGQRMSPCRVVSASTREIVALCD